jgi:hypothetical protein
MRRLGTRRTVWIVFILAIAIISVTGFVAPKGGLIMPIVFITAGLSTVAVQGAVAHANWRGVENLITRQV